MQWMFLLLPTIVYLGFIYFYPLFKMLSLSLFDPAFTLGHFKKVFETATYLKVIRQTFEISFAVTAICLVLGYLIAYLLSHVSSKTMNLLMILVIIPFWTSMLVRTYAWMVILGRKGVVNQLLLGAGLFDQPLKMIHNTFGVYVGMVHILLPYMILPIYSVMRGIDKNLVSAAQSLGANPVKSFTRVFLPLSLPGVVAGVILVFILALGFFITPALLGGLTNVMISMLIERQVNELLKWGFASALGIALLVLTVAVFALFKLISKWLRIEDSEGALF